MTNITHVFGIFEGIVDLNTNRSIVAILSFEKVLDVG
jgi:hypothetical protein